MKILFNLGDNKEYPCIIKESSRAKRVLLKRSRTGELLLVVPQNRSLSQQAVHQILEKNKDWILKTHKEEISAPDSIYLEAIGELWTIEYKASGYVKVKKKIDKENKILEIYSAHSLEDIAKCINSFLVSYSRDFLAKRLDYCSKAFQIELKHNEEVKISLARGRWGSYAKKRNITLNARLLLFSVDLVDYILLHELCHTVHFNHSKDFYALLEEKMPDYKQREKEIKDYDLPPILWL